MQAINGRCIVLLLILVGAYGIPAHEMKFKAPRFVAFSLIRQPEFEGPTV